MRKKLLFELGQMQERAVEQQKAALARAIDGKNVSNAVDAEAELHHIAKAFERLEEAVIEHF